MIFQTCNMLTSYDIEEVAKYVKTNFVLANNIPLYRCFVGQNDEIF